MINVNATAIIEAIIEETNNPVFNSFLNIKTLDKTYKILKNTKNSKTPNFVIAYYNLNCCLLIYKGAKVNKILNQKHIKIYFSVSTT